MLISKKGYILKKYKAKIKLVIKSDRTNFYGPGINELLILIDQYQSTKEAAGAMGLSYSKALKIIKRCEKELGFDIIKSKRGGADGGKSILTEEGRNIMTAYKDFNDEVNEDLEEKFYKYFSFLDKN